MLFYCKKKVIFIIFIYLTFNINKLFNINDLHHHIYGMLLDAKFALSYTNLLIIIYSCDN